MSHGRVVLKIKLLLVYYVSPSFFFLFFFAYQYESLYLFTLAIHILATQYTVIPFHFLYKSYFFLVLVTLSSPNFPQNLKHFLSVISNQHVFSQFIFPSPSNYLSWPPLTSCSNSVCSLSLLHSSVIWNPIIFSCYGSSVSRSYFLPHYLPHFFILSRNIHPVAF